MFFQLFLLQLLAQLNDTLQLSAVFIFFLTAARFDCGIQQGHDGRSCYCGCGWRSDRRRLRRRRLLLLLWRGGGVLIGCVLYRRCGGGSGVRLLLLLLRRRSVHHWLLRRRRLLLRTTHSSRGGGCRGWRGAILRAIVTAVPRVLIRHRCRGRSRSRVVLLRLLLQRVLLLQLLRLLCCVLWLSGLLLLLWWWRLGGISLGWGIGLLGCNSRWIRSRLRLLLLLWRCVGLLRRWKRLLVRVGCPIRLRRRLLLHVALLLLLRRRHTSWRIHPRLLLLLLWSRGSVWHLLLLLLRLLLWLLLWRRSSRCKPKRIK